MPTSPTTDCASRLALLELAADIGWSNLRDPKRIAFILRMREAQREADIQRLEATVDVLRRMRIPHLEGEVRSLKLDRDEWSAKAKDAEARLLWGIGVILLLAMALVALVAFTIAENGLVRHVATGVYVLVILITLAAGTGYWLATGDHLLEWKRAIVNRALKFWYTKVDR